MEKIPKSFTAEYDQIVTVLFSLVWVSRAFDPSTVAELNPQSIGARQYRAFWDTGAPHCVIDRKIINECKLEPIRTVKIQTIHEEHDASVYRISLFLPNRVVISELEAVEGSIKDADMLIGMNIINQGDFAITNIDGKTTMSFRIPSSERIDFTHRETRALVGTDEILSSSPKASFSPKVGRNDPCPCGSGKKYKKCCGK